MTTLREDVQTHTNYSDGENTITQMVKSAIGIGVKSIIISDHAKGWTSSDGTKAEFFPTCERYANYLQEIEDIKNIFKDKITIFSGLEIEIGIQGDFKLDAGIIEYAQKHKNKEKFGVDILLGTIHSESFEEDCTKQGIRAQDKRPAMLDNIINLIQNKKIDIFAHPFQGVHGQFSNNLSRIEAEQIVNAFEKKWQSDHAIFELNGKKYPRYEQWSYNKYEKGELETHDINFLHLYKKRGGKFVLGSDAHSIQGLTNTDFSVFIDLPPFTSVLY